MTCDFIIRDGTDRFQNELSEERFDTHITRF